ncbi:FtsQ-type POTRA domain-containing protein [Herbiconiux moechotypicola]|uniref:FtsQ-type POTRA domain-containing protein n=1 Tax=Herbiconiux moechotypicola TaxID=637393 RepID=UPI00217E247B|nr:FtsQ-type POTRA domain-containing protein [Herbiconiux moechotypicola]MCS5730481.1 FtsQ-type POTRA domain-containing protein [Herbiconiux moechotypicola]
MRRPKPATHTRADSEATVPVDRLDTVASRGPRGADADADATVPVDRIDTQAGTRSDADARGAMRAPARASESTAARRGTTVKARPATTTASAERARRAPGASELADDGEPDAPQAARSSAAARRELRRATRRRRRFERLEARRFTVRSRRRRLAWAVSGAVLGSLVLLVLLVAYSPLLSVRQIVIEGTSRLDPGTVTSALAEQQGRPLALVDYGAIEQELAGFPLIASYSVEARPPDTLAVRLVERRPVAQVQTEQGYQLIDAAGVTVQQSAERIAGFPLLDLSGTTFGGPGFEAAAAVLMSLPDALLTQVDSISGTTPDSVTMVFTGAGQRVVWGSAEDSDLKALILQRLIATQDPAAAVEYDVSSPQSPVIR